MTRENRHSTHLHVRVGAESCLVGSPSCHVRVRGSRDIAEDLSERLHQQVDLQGGSERRIAAGRKRDCRAAEEADETAALQRERRWRTGRTAAMLWQAGRPEHKRRWQPCSASSHALASRPCAVRKHILIANERLSCALCKPTPSSHESLGVWPPWYLSSSRRTIIVNATQSSHSDLLVVGLVLEL